MSSFNAFIEKSKHVKRRVKLAANLPRPISSFPPAAAFFLFHTIEQAENPWTHGHRYITPLPVFRKQIEFIKKNFAIESTGSLLRKLKDSSLDRTSAAIHFDDGFNSYTDLALPFLKEQDIPSTVFLINSVLNGDVPIRNKIAFCLNTDKKDRLLKALQPITMKTGKTGVNPVEMQAPEFLSWIKTHLTKEMEAIINDIFYSGKIMHQIESPFLGEKAAAKLANDPFVEIGSHTINHPMLSKLDDSEQKEEIISGHLKLEELFGCKLEYFAYPHGGHSHFNETSRRIIMENKRLTSFSTYGGINFKFDRADVKRITLNTHSPFDIKLSVLKGII